MVSHKSINKSHLYYEFYIKNGSAILNYNNIERPKSDKTAQQRAQEKYAENVKHINIRTNKSVYELFNSYCDSMHMTKKDLFEKAVQYYIDNH